MLTTKLSCASRNASWDTIDWAADPDRDFTLSADGTPEQLYALWDSTIERSRATLGAALASGGLDQFVHLSCPAGCHASLRCLICDPSEECGRHAGHGDLLHEAIDGRVGEDSRAGRAPGIHRLPTQLRIGPCSR